MLLGALGQRGDLPDLVAGQRGLRRRSSSTSSSTTRRRPGRRRARSPCCRASSRRPRASTLSTRKWSGVTVPLDDASRRARSSPRSRSSSGRRWRGSASSPRPRRAPAPSAGRRRAICTSSCAMPRSRAVGDRARPVYRLRPAARGRASSTASAPTTHRYVSCWPAKEASARVLGRRARAHRDRDVVAERRVAARIARDVRGSGVLPRSAAGGRGLERRHVVGVERGETRDAPGDVAAERSRNAPVVTAKPSGPGTRPAASCRGSRLAATRDLALPQRSKARRAGRGPLDEHAVGARNVVFGG